MKAGENKKSHLTKYAIPMGNGRKYVNLCCYHFFKLGRRKECWKKQTIILLPPLQRQQFLTAMKTNKQINRQLFLHKKWKL